MTLLAAPVAQDALTVLQSVPAWLPQTQTWLHTQTRFLPGSIDSHIVCERTEHLEQFTIPNIHSLGAGPRWRRVLDRLCRGMRLRRYPGHMPSVARQTGAAILHSHFGHVGWLDLGAVRRCELRQVVTFYGQDLNYLPQAMRRDLPVIPTTPEDVYRTLRLYLTERRHELPEIGRRSRVFVEAWHDPAKIAARLKRDYEEILASPM